MQSTPALATLSQWYLTLGQSSQIYTVALGRAKTLKNHNFKYLMIVLQWFYIVIYENKFRKYHCCFFQWFFTRFVIFCPPPDNDVFTNVRATINSNSMKYISSCSILSPKSKMHLIFKINWDLSKIWPKVHFYTVCLD